MPYPHFVPSRLTLFRLHRGLTRSDLHQALIQGGVRRCRALIDHWERGRSEPRASDLFALSCILGRPMAAFFEPMSELLPE